MTIFAAGRSGTDSLRQLFYALMDLRIHAEYVPGANTTVEQSAVYKDVVAKTSVMPPLPEDRCACCSSHWAHSRSAMQLCPSSRNLEALSCSCQRRERSSSDWHAARSTSPRNLQALRGCC
jgi:hypothetical protein